MQRAKPCSAGSGSMSAAARPLTRCSPEPTRLRHPHAALSPGAAEAAAAAAIAEAAAAGPPETAAWDPDGLFGGVAAPSGGHFARRERQRATAAGQQLLRAGGVRPIPPEALAAGGLLAADVGAYDRPAFEQLLAEKHMAVNLDFPGLRIMHLDPPVLLAPGFFTGAQCEEAIAAGVSSGELQTSKVGGGNVTDALAATASARRTSSSLLLDAAMRQRQPALDAVAARMQARGWELLGVPPVGGGWGRQGFLPAPQQYAYESLQLARYERGQYFLSHEDGFPAPLAQSNGFQRHATLLLYLNDVQQGGATSFDLLGLSVQPQQGSILLFFPAFADGSADARTLHTAEDAADTKWVMQQWVARGCPGSGALDPIEAALAAMPQPAVKAPAVPPARPPPTPRRRQEDEEALAADQLLAGRKGGKKRGGDKQGTAPAPGRGFGAK